VIDPRALHLGGKDLDGLPGEWTFPIFAHRHTVATFPAGQVYYEPIDDLKGLSNVMIYRELLRDDGLGELAECITTTATIDLYSSAYGAKDGELELPANGRYVGTHNVALTEDYENSYGFRNSWGRNWGRDGHGSLSYRYARRHVRERWVVRYRLLGPPSSYAQHALSHPEHRGNPAFQGLGPNAFLWGGETEPELTERSNERRASLAALPDLRPVEVLWIVGVFGLPIAWAHLRQLPGRRWQLEECFVLPDHRTKGLGTRLIGWATQQVLTHKGQALLFALHDGDRVSIESGSRPVVLPTSLKQARWTTRQGQIAALGRLAI